MGNFKRNDRSGGRDDKRRAGWGAGRRDFGGRSDKPTMHKAVCDECGNSCAVPFRPSGDKPVYCNDCFGNNRPTGSVRNDHRDARKNFGGRTGDRPDMHEAVCTTCGTTCEVPFRPTGDKPVYCNQCFGKGNHVRGKNGGAAAGGLDADRLATLNTKLDTIIDLLTAASFVRQERPSQEKSEGKTAMLTDDEPRDALAKNTLKKSGVKKKTDSKKQPIKKTKKAKKK